MAEPSGSGKELEVHDDEEKSLSREHGVDASPQGTASTALVVGVWQKNEEEL